VAVPLDVIDIDEVNTTTFYKKMYRNEPFIIAGAAKRLPAFTKWVGDSKPGGERAAGDETGGYSRAAGDSRAAGVSNSGVGDSRVGDAYLLAAAGEAEVDVEKSRDGRFADFMPGWRKEKMRFGDFLRDYGGDGDSGGGGLGLATRSLTACSTCNCTHLPHSPAWPGPLLS